MSIMMNADFDTDAGNDLMCNVNQIVMNHKGLKHNLHCRSVKPKGFSCYLYDINQDPLCKPISRDVNQSWADCTQSCNKEEKFGCQLFQVGTTKLPLCTGNKTGGVSAQSCWDSRDRKSVV